MYGSVGSCSGYRKKNLCQLSFFTSLFLGGRNGSISERSEGPALGSEEQRRARGARKGTDSYVRHY
jgi:hypothetical protein